MEKSDHCLHCSSASFRGITLWNTVKILNFRTPKMFSEIKLEIKQRSFHRETCPKNRDRMTNSLDPDQTAPPLGAAPSLGAV